jgi:hypothetical protein
MNRLSAKLTASFFASCAALILILLSPVSSQAQQTPAQPSNPPDAGARYPDSDMQVRTIELERERALARKRDPNAILNEVNEDLHRLQTLNEEMARAASAGQQLDFKYVLDSTTEIKKRALRLKIDLALLPGAKEEKGRANKEADDGQLQPGLAALNKLLDGFLHNAIFSDPGTPDPHLAAQAKRDLDDIITLSEKLRKTADKLNKSGGKG